MDLGQGLAQRATEWLRAAKQAYREHLYNAAYELGRTAAELASKALLFRAKGTYPKEHNVAGALHQHRLLPAGVSETKLSRLLADFTRGSYGFNEPVEPAEAKRAIDLASQILDLL